MGEKAMSFLNNKSFHPGNAQNRYKLFIAEEKKKAEDVRTEELSREYAQQEARRQLKSAITGGPDNSAVSFMYNAPPGLAESENRKKMAQLEKDKTPAERDVDRFGTLLANAPREGSYTTAMEVTHKPFGVELRKVRCTKCGQWGHQRGDRECPMRNAIGAMDEEAKSKHDPIGRLAGAESSGEALRWELKRVPGEGQRGGASASDANQQFLAAEEEDEAEGVGGTRLSDIDPEVLAMLSEKQQRKLLRMYGRGLQVLDGADADDGGGGGKKRKKSDKSEKDHKREKSRKKSSKGHRKKEKRKKRERRSRSSSSSRSSS